MALIIFPYLFGMVIFPNCKINIGLRVLQKRTDGFHNLETIFYPIPLHDILEIVVTDAADDSFTQTGLSINGATADNLCMKALQLVRQQFPDLPAVHMHLHKMIPMGAGLGGGSSNGSHCLLLLNQLFELSLTKEELAEMALLLGSDCPFFIYNQPCFAWSRGEKMTPIGLHLKGFQLVLINPGIHINTGWAFGQIFPEIPTNSLSNLHQLPVSKWQDVVINDFQQPASIKYPEIQQIIDYSLSSGAIFAAMTGTGSTCFAIFAPNYSLPDFQAFSHCWMRRMTLP